MVRKLIIGLLLLGVNHLVGAQSIRLASHGVAHYGIFVATPGHVSAFAGAELNRYLEQLAGVPFPVTEQPTERSIVIGSAADLIGHPGNIAIPLLENEAYGIVVRDERIYIVGGTERTMLYAVYDFLSTLGCRWIAPAFAHYEGKAQDVPLRTELAYVYTGDIIKRPLLKYRKLYIEEGRSHTIESLRQLVDWMPKSRFNILVAPLDYQGHGRVRWDNWRDALIPELTKRGITIEVGGHGYQNFLNAKMESGRLFAEHPQWFGMDDQGNRTAEPRVVFCTSNADALTYLHERIRNYLKARPEIEIFDFWPPDSERWCTCADCALLGAPADRHALLVNQTAQYLRANCPQVKLECLAYLQYTDPPVHTTLDSCVLLDFCPIDQHFEHQIYEKESENNRVYNERLRSWLSKFNGDISVYSYYRKYAWRSLPNIIPHYIQNDLRYYHDIGVNGISVYSEPGDWFTYGLNHYVLGQLAWNPYTNVDSLIQEYCSTLYGEAAPLVKGIYAELAQIVRFGADIRFSQPKTVAEYEVFIARLNTCTAQVEMAMADQAANTVSYRHLGRVKLMLEYATASILINMLTTEGKTGEADRVAADMKQLMIENKQAGVFIPR